VPVLNQLIDDSITDAPREKRQACFKGMTEHFRDYGSCHRLCGLADLRRGFDCVSSSRIFFNYTLPS
jgi:hypothetical protein